MRVALVILIVAGGLVGQEPPVLTTLPPVQSPAFGAAALGGGVTEVAQLSLLFMPGTSPQKWYLTATVRTPRSNFYAGYTGEVTSAGPGRYTIASASAAELVNVPPPVFDSWSFSASFDRKVLVHDSSGSTSPAVLVRNSDVTGTPYRPFGSIGAPVPIGYRDSQVGDTIASWNGTTGTYEFLYIDGQDLKKVRMTLTAPATVTLGTPVTVATSGMQKHSPSPLRQTTGPASELGRCRALLFAQNDFSANSYFRSSLDDRSVVPAPELEVYSDIFWKANPGAIGGSLYWAYALQTYSDPLQEDVVAMSSVRIPVAGGTETICCWAPPSTQPQLGFVIVGAAISPGFSLAPLVTRGRLGIWNRLLVLPAQLFDPVTGEMSYTLAFPGMPRPVAVDMQVGYLNLATNQVFLGNTAGVYWR